MKDYCCFRVAERVAIKSTIKEHYRQNAAESVSFTVGTKTTITTKKPGAFKLQVVGQQNDTTLTGIHVKSEEIECEAAVKVVSAVQKSAKEVLFTFDNDMTGIVDAKDFKVYYKPVNGADVTTAVEKVIVQDDPTKVVVRLWNAFVEGTEYYVEYSGQVTKFTTAKLDIEHAASIRVNELEITKGKVTEYDFDVLDANGVELDHDTMVAYVSFAGDSTDKIQISTSTILFDEAGLQANVTATFDAWYEDSEGNAKQNTFKNAFLFKSVDVAKVTIGSYYWMISNDNFVTDDPDDFADGTKLIAVDDEKIGNGMLSLLVEFTDGSALGYFGGGAVPFANGVEDDFASQVAPYVTLAIADPSIAEINATNGSILPVKVGTTQILVKVEGQDSPILVLPLDVKAKAVPQTITITPDKTKLNTDPTVNDEVNFEVLVKDQYGRPFWGAAIEACAASFSTKTVAATGDAAGVLDVDVTDYEGLAKLTFEGDTSNNNSIVGTGVVVIKVTATYGSTKISNSTKSIQAKATAGAISKYVLDVEDTKLNQIVGKAKKDLKLSSKKSNTAIEIYGVDSQGFRATINTGAKLFDKNNLSTASTDGYSFKAFNKGAEMLRADGFIADGRLSSVIAPATDVEKLDATSVQIKLYKVVLDNKGAIKSQTSVDTVTVTITDSQPGLVVKKTSDKIADTNDATIMGAFDVFYIGLEDTDKVAPATVVTKKGTKSVYVDKFTYVETVDAADDPSFAGKDLTVSGKAGYTLLVNAD